MIKSEDKMPDIKIYIPKHECENIIIYPYEDEKEYDWYMAKTKDNGLYFTIDKKELANLLFEVNENEK